MKVGDRIDHSKQPKPKTGKDIYGAPPKIPNWKKSVQKGVVGNIKEKFKQKKRKKDIEATARRVQTECEKEGKPFDSDRTVIADKKRTLVKKKRLGKYDSNVRKALTAACGLSSPGTKTQGDALQGESVDKKIHKVSKSEIRAVMRSISEESFQRFQKKEELLDFLAMRLPNIGEKEKIALAKAIAYMREKKQELALKALVDDE